MGAALEDLVGSALGVLYQAGLGLMDGTHHLTAGIKGSLVHTGLLGFQLTLGQVQAGGVVDQSTLGGLALGLAVFAGLGVAAQAHGGGQRNFLAPVLHHGHLVLGQGTGLIRADNLSAAQGLHGGEPADNGVALGHVGNADGQNHGHNSGQTFGNGGNSQADRYHEGAEDDVQMEVAGLDQAEDKDEHTDAQHQPAEGFAQLSQLFLQGGLLVLGVGQGRGDLAHLGVHTGAGDHGAAAAKHHGAAHVHHILAVAQGNLGILTAQAQGLDALVDRHAFTGEGGFLDLEAGAFQDTAVGGNRVAGFQDHHVAGNQLGAGQYHLLAVPQHLTGGGGHALQGFDGGFGLALLVYAQNSVEQNHQQNDDYIGKALAGGYRGNTRNGSRCQKDQQHGVFQLGDEPLQQSGLAGLGQLVGTVFGGPLGGLLAGQAVGSTAKLLQHFV